MYYLNSPSEMLGLGALAAWWVEAFIGMLILARWLPGGGRARRRATDDSWAQGPSLSILGHVGMVLGVAFFTYCVVAGQGRLTSPVTIGDTCEDPSRREIAERHAAERDSGAVQLVAHRQVGVGRQPEGRRLDVDAHGLAEGGEEVDDHEHGIVAAPLGERDDAGLVGAVHDEVAQPLEGRVGTPDLVEPGDEGVQRPRVVPVARP